MIPKSRIESFIQAIIDGAAVPYEPQSRIETYFADMIEQRASTLPPVFRIEKFLAKITGANVEVPEPQTRAEKYLAAIASPGSVVLPVKPNSSLEKYLEQLVLRMSDLPIAIVGEAIVNFCIVGSAD